MPFAATQIIKFGYAHAWLACTWLQAEAYRRPGPGKDWRGRSVCPCKAATAIKDRCRLGGSPVKGLQFALVGSRGCSELFQILS